jgi:putative tryptophan/tyrosine transport system substrate-binding protein
MKGLLCIVLFVLLGLGPLAAQAPVHRIGVLGTSSEDRLRGLIVPQLAKVGLVEGRKLVLDVRTGTAAQLPMLARELIALDVNLIITSGDAATTAAKSVTKTVPIVMFSGDPIGQGLIGSLSHPGGNVTGVSLLSRTLEAKRLELLRDALPKARRIAALLDSFQLRVAALRQEISEAAANAGVEVLFFETAGPEDYERAFSAIRAARPDALTISASPQFARDGLRLARLALETGLPTACEWREMTEQGCLLSYNASITKLWGRAADYVDRILKGASPSEMPVEQPTHFEFVLNIKTAKTLRLDLPASLLARADEVIE